MKKPSPRGNAVTNIRIVSIRDQDKLSRNDLARLTGYSRGYVDQWLNPPTSKYWRRAPANAVRLLELETGRRAPARIRLSPEARNALLEE